MDCGLCPDGQFCQSNGSCASLDLTWATVTPGTFTMGSPAVETGRDIFTGYPDETLPETSHPVTITRSFQIATTEVTQSDFSLIMAFNPSYFTGCGPTCPVETVTWDQAAEFCNLLSLDRRLDPCFTCAGSSESMVCSISSQYANPSDCPGYRLPTEAEWEYTARGGSSLAFWKADITAPECDPLDVQLDQIAWYRANALFPGGLDTTCGTQSITVGPRPVAGKLANAYGLFDVSGNVWEWTLDCANDYSMLGQVDPVGPLSCLGRYRVFRGGAFTSDALYCRSAERADSPYDTDCLPSNPDCFRKAFDIGFRPIRTLPNP